MFQILQFRYRDGVICLYMLSSDILKWEIFVLIDVLQHARRAWTNRAIYEFWEVTFYLSTHITLYSQESSWKQHNFSETNTLQRLKWQMGFFSYFVAFRPFSLKMLSRCDPSMLSHKTRLDTVLLLNLNSLFGFVSQIIGAKKSTI